MINIIPEVARPFVIPNFGVSVQVGYHTYFVNFHVPIVEHGTQGILLNRAFMQMSVLLNSHELNLKGDFTN